MSNRIKALTVVLEPEMRDEDADRLALAIRQLRGVIAVDKHVKDINSYTAESCAKHALTQKLWDVLKW